MSSGVEHGRRLEQAIAAYLATCGYATRCNQVLEGRSGGRHEIDVLAETSDALTTFRVAVECKAWQSPIEKDVVSKLSYVIGDLGLNKGIIASLGGCRAGAHQAAASLGIELWGPDELRRHLGEATVGELGVRARANRTLAWGFAPTVSVEQATPILEASGKGRFKLRTIEQLVWVSPVWLPVHCIRLTVAQPDTGLRRRLRSTTVDNLYEGLGGAHLGSIRNPQWEQVNAHDHTALRPSMSETKVHSTLRKAVEGYRRVSSSAAVERHTATLTGLGIPTPCESLSIDGTWLVYLPYVAGVLDSGGRQRVVAVNAWTGELSDSVSRTLTTHLPQIRSHFWSR